MKSLSKLFRIGNGPSASHTIGPATAARSFLKQVKDDKPDLIKATLYRSIALTGKGHHSDFIISSIFSPIPCEVIFDFYSEAPHPIYFSFEAFRDGVPFKKCHYTSLGGGEVTSEDDLEVNEKDIYPVLNFQHVKQIMEEKGLKSLKEFALLYEDPSIDDYLNEAVLKMFSAVENGLSKSGKIPANDNPRLQWTRSGGRIVKEASCLPEESRKDMYLMGYAMAVAESNASGEEIVTGPTCGSCGVLPSILYYMHKNKGYSFESCKDALYTAGIFGNIVKQNATIVGAVGGCQAEIGTASAMAAAALCAMDGLKLYEQEFAAECALEHFLGLSCDPADGYVMIPCIERNGFGALRAHAAYLYAKYVGKIKKNQVNFDDVVAAMKLTGDALAEAYKETSEGGLAEILRQKRSE